MTNANMTATVVVAAIRKKHNKIIESRWYDLLLSAFYMEMTGNEM